MSKLFFKKILIFTLFISFLSINIPFISFAQDAVQPGGRVGPTLVNAGVNNDATPEVLEPFVGPPAPEPSPTTDIAQTFLQTCMTQLGAQLMGGWVASILGNVANIATSALTFQVPVINPTQNVKEISGPGGLVPSMDAIANCVINGAIEAILVDTTRWIQSGANGKPLFLENPEKFFTGLADETFGQVVDNMVSGMDLCEPISVQIKLNLLSGQPIRGKPDVCTLSEISDNFESFMQGNFEDGGWSSWFELTQINNPNSIELDAMTKAMSEVEKKSNQIKMELNWGKGFMGKRDADGNVTWPGTLLTNMIEKTSGIKADRIAFADEFNELVTATIDLFVKKVFEGFQQGRLTL